MSIGSLLSPPDSSLIPYFFYPPNNTGVHKAPHKQAVTSISRYKGFYFRAATYIQLIVAQAKREEEGRGPPLQSSLPHTTTKLKGPTLAVTI